MSDGTIRYKVNCKLPKANATNNLQAKTCFKCQMELSDIKLITNYLKQNNATNNLQAKTCLEFPSHHTKGQRS